MRCSHCLRELDDSGARCDCGGAAAESSQRDVALLVRPAEPVALAVPQTPEARLAQSVGRGFRQLVDSPQLARPLRLVKTYWPVAVIPSTAAVVAVVGVKTSLTVVGSVLYWGMSIGMQLLANM